MPTKVLFFQILKKIAHKKHFCQHQKLKNRYNFVHFFKKNPLNTNFWRKIAMKILE